MGTYETYKAALDAERNGTATETQARLANLVRDLQRVPAEKLPEDIQTALRKLGETEVAESLARVRGEVRRQEADR